MKLERAKGTRDFSPKEQMLRKYVMSKLSKVFELYGFSPLATPIIERYDVLAAKFTAGEESDAMKEVFTFNDQGNRKLGLRYELTFPLARYIGMNQNTRMPFKRYQIGRVYRDGPIRLGRYREFWQCDVDIVGCNGIIADAEIIAVLKRGFKELDMDVTIEVNDRKLLNDILSFAGINEELREATLISIDKLKKVGPKGIADELNSKGVSGDQIKKVIELISVEGSNSEKLKLLQEKLGDTEGIIEITELFEWLNKFNVSFEFNPALARGLAYYTGPIFEVFLKGSEITSSFAGGGRWDKMIGNYLGTKEIVPATGVAFGLEPITEELKLRGFNTKESVTDVYVIPIGDTKQRAVQIVEDLRNSGIKSDLDLIGRNLSKNLDFANKMNIPYVVFIGEDEVKQNKIKLRDMNSGDENLVTLSEALKILNGDSDED
ncbi:histidine--tRNA ligase [archaeon]|jgi:histidyl-tRNA synthetase|nr:histidine--tRNA ligase [archaeon]MBT4022332.1 histidine--tRNA ligase [archaeon]MBT4273210.1 histidine--tRNA ligase [archaeon]MBT4461347.1 histidine--tRNA ligase [archaeon]MBT4858909.1 histidine--tRNA ligase [archaeon]